MLIAAALSCRKIGITVVLKGMLFPLYYVYVGDIRAQNRMNAVGFFYFVSLQNSAVVKC